MKIISRIKKIWELSKKDLKVLDEISIEEIKELPNVGNGKAIFIPLMSELERDKYLHDEMPVWKKFNEKLKELI
jgi:hypothetical protein